MAIKFGWCSDEYHKKCRVHYRDRYEPEKIHECGCECHKEGKKPELPPMHDPFPDPEKKVRKLRKKLQ